MGGLKNWGRGMKRLKPIQNTGERALHTTAQEVASDLGMQVFSKIRIADVLPIDNSGISDALFSYALRAHFDTLVVRDNIGHMAIEFDGPGHDARHDAKKAELCDLFAVPLVRVRIGHVNARNFEDTAVSFLIHQLGCVDHFLEIYGNDPYEPYDPAWFVSVAGKDRKWPFNYAGRWRGRLKKHLKENAHKLEGHFQGMYANGLVGLGAIEAAFVKDERWFRCVSGLVTATDRAIWGVAKLDFEVCGLTGRRRELFMELASFVDGLAAEEMFLKTIAFFDGDETVVKPIVHLHELLQNWSEAGFLQRRGNVQPSGGPYLRFSD
jgi:hypothetical protein